uniref:Uncharacterized protein n=1 Tax=Clytia hemisphaerica TaxID=252671 RepID=A0A7M5VF02_9CNID
IITKRSDVRKAYRNLRERYNDLNTYITQIQINLFASVEIVSSLMKNGRRNLSPSQEKILANLNQVIEEAKYLTRDFGDRHKICQRKLKEIDGGLDCIKDINELKSIYQYLKESFDALENFTKIQESQLDACRGHLERYQPNEPIKIVQQTKDDVIPKTSQQASLKSNSNGLFSKELKPLDTCSSAVAQEPSLGGQNQTTSSTDALNTELSEFSDSLNFRRVGSKRSSSVIK